MKRKGRQRVGSVSRALCPNVVTLLFWTLKSGVASHLSTRHPSEQRNQQICGVDAGLSLPRGTLFLVAKDLGACHLGHFEEVTSWRH